MSSLPRAEATFKPQPNLVQPSTRQSIEVGGRHVGYVTGDAFHKDVKSSRHMLRRPCRSWAADLGSLEDAQAAGARFLELHDGDTGAEYRVVITTLLDHGFLVDRGYGRQVALPVDKWQRPDVSEQLSLFVMDGVR